MATTRGAGDRRDYRHLGTFFKIIFLVLRGLGLDFGQAHTEREEKSTRVGIPPVDW